MVANGLGRIAADDEIVLVAIDHLAAVVDLCRHALEDGGGGKALIGCFGGRSGVFGVLRRAKVTEQGCEHASLLAKTYKV